MNYELYDFMQGSNGLSYLFHLRISPWYLFNTFYINKLYLTSETCHVLNILKLQAAM